METNQTLAPLAALIFLGTAGLAAAGSLYAAWRALRGDAPRAGRVLGAVCVLLASYGTVLGIGGLMGRERVVSAGAEKYFCELDCHLAYAVIGVESAGGADGGGRLWTVTIRTRFDEKTISPRRSPTAPLWPVPMRVALVTADDRRFAPLTADDPASAPYSAGSAPMTQPLRPGESYETTLVFPLPPDAVPSRLLLEDDIPISPLLIGNERSPFHRPVYLGLPGQE